jgi:glycosyltransferase involved in cell wall biosynthesis
MRDPQPIRISAVIPAYNAAAFIAEPITSILAQTRPVEEIIVIDDGSSDQTAEVAAHFPKTRVIRRQNGGQAAARNTGIMNASGNWIAFLDHDDVWEKEKIEIQTALIAPDVGVVHANDFDRISFGSLWHRQAHITPSGAIVRTQTLLEVGGFEECREVSGVEDLVLWLKIATTDWQFVRSPGRSFQWRQNGLNQSSDDLKMLRAELAAVSLLGKRVGCDEREISRIQQAARVEYAKNLVVARRWQEAVEVLRECSPGHARRCLSLATAIKASGLARTELVQMLQVYDARYDSHPCTGGCTLRETQRFLCMASCKEPCFRPRVHV